MDGSVADAVMDKRNEGLVRRAVHAATSPRALLIEGAVIAAGTVAYVATRPRPEPREYNGGGGSPRHHGPVIDMDTLYAAGL